jgi:protein-S-isoprenylcysteine O-methyltransferase Ste14
MALSWLGKWVYGAVFVVLPIALAAWAMATVDTVRLPAVTSRPFGLAVASIGMALLLMGIAHLWIYGGGLPMNAYPPPRYVARGVFRFLPHPIYTGFSALSVGVSIIAGSASDRHRGGGHPPTPATPPCIRVRTRRFESVTLTLLK